MLRKFTSQRGISIIAAVFTLIILGIFGAAIVTLVTTEHEMRIGQLSEDWAFYNVQTGFEYAVREVDQGGYPEVTDKQFYRGNFTVDVNYVEGSEREIIVTGNVGNVRKSYVIDHTPFAGDCLSVNTASAVASGLGNEDLTGIVLQKICNEAVSIDKMTISWVTDGGEKFTQIRIGGADVWNEPLGLGSGETADITDTKLDTIANYDINFIRFTSSMSGKNVTIRFIMTDTSTETVNFDLP